MTCIKSSQQTGMKQGKRTLLTYLSALSLIASGICPSNIFKHKIPIKWIGLLGISNDYCLNWLNQANVRQSSTVLGEYWVYFSYQNEWQNTMIKTQLRHCIC